jgi:hypothetical protein
LYCAWIGLLCCPALARAQAEPPPPIKFGRVTFTGYVQADYRTTLDGEVDAPLEGFLIRRARVASIIELAPTISAVVRVDVSASPIARDLYIDFSGIPGATFRFGQFIAPFSLERLTSTSRLELIDRSVVAELLTPSRDMGAMVFNAKPFWGWLSYYAAVVNGTGQNNRDNNKAKDVVGRVSAAIPRAKGMTVSINANGGTQPEGSRRRYGADLGYERRGFRATAEWVQQTLDGPEAQTLTGLVLIGVWKRPARKRTAYFAGYELDARIVDLDDSRDTIQQRELQFGGNYYITPQVRAMSNLVVPIGDDQPITRTRWWSRIQVWF